MFDLKTFKTLGRIPAAEDADAIIYDAASNRVFTFNGDAHSSTVIDPAAGSSITNIPLGGKPEYGVSAGDGKVYANLTDTSEVVEIDAKAATVTRRWSTAPCKQPVAMAIDVAHHRLFSGCRSGVMAVSDYQAGKVVATAPIGTGVDGAAFDPATGDAFASNADGTLDGDSPGLARHISRRADLEDDDGVAECGPGPNDPRAVAARRDVRGGRGSRWINDATEAEAGAGLLRAHDGRAEIGDSSRRRQLAGASPSLNHSAHCDSRVCSSSGHECGPTVDCGADR